MARVYKIEGLDDCIKCLDRAPANVVKMTRTAMREAGKQTARLIRQRTPGRFRRLVGYKVSKGQLSGNTYALVGYFNKSGKKASNRDIPDWFKAYWKNYGTLARRDASHHFVTPVKKGRVPGRRNQMGQPAVNFFEAAIGGWENQFLNAFQNSMKAQENKLTE